MHRFYLVCCFIGCICLCPSTIMAQALDASGILERMAEAFQKAGGIEADFSVRTSEGTSTGHISLLGEKFVLKSEGVITWFDGHTQWTYLLANEEVNISEPTPEELQSINPYALLSLYKHGYTPKLRTSSKPSQYEVALLADDVHQDLLCIILYINKVSFIPQCISMAQRGGETAVVTIQHFRTGQQFQPFFFTFDAQAFPDAEIIDLR